MKLQSKEKGERRTCNREVNQRYGWALYIQMIPFCQPSLEEVEIHHSLFHLMTNKQADKKTPKKPNHAARSGIWLCKNRRLWTGVIFAKKEERVFAEPQEVSPTSCLTPLGGDEQPLQSEGERGSHRNPTPGLVAWGWPGQG